MVVLVDEQVVSLEEQCDSYANLSFHLTEPQSEDF